MKQKIEILLAILLVIILKLIDVFIWS